jgi:hypothetical protein
MINYNYQKAVKELRGLKFRAIKTGKKEITNLEIRTAATGIWMNSGN